jgi:regulator of sigma D
MCKYKVRKNHSDSITLSFPLQTQIYYSFHSINAIGCKILYIDVWWSAKYTLFNASSTNYNRCQDTEDLDTYVSLKAWSFSVFCENLSTYLMVFHYGVSLNLLSKWQQTQTKQARHLGAKVWGSTWLQSQQLI